MSERLGFGLIRRGLQSLVAIGCFLMSVSPALAKPGGEAGAAAETRASYAESISDSSPAAGVTDNTSAASTIDYLSGPDVDPGTVTSGATDGLAVACVTSPTVSPTPPADIHQILVTLNGNAMWAGQFAAPVAAIETAVGNWTKDRIACGAQNIAAQKSCLESCSAPLQGALALGQQATSAISAMVGKSSMACSELSKGLSLVQAGFVAYDAACGLAKMSCDKSCGMAVKDSVTIGAQVDKLPLACNTLRGTPEAAELPDCIKDATRASAAIQAILAKDRAPAGDTIGAKSKQCSADFSQKLQQATVSSLALVKSALDATKCAKAVAASAVLNCSLAANAQNQTCICQGNPRLPGCSNTLAKENAMNASFGASSEIAKPSTPAASSVSLPGEPAATMPSQQASTALGGGGGLSGGGGGGGGLAPPAADKAAAPSGGSRLNSSILGGDSGGGGGGGSSYGSRGSSSDEMRNYLPGGARDPNRMISGGFVVPKDVTGSGGRSNWEKVTDRYRDAKSTLLNQ